MKIKMTNPDNPTKQDRLAYMRRTLSLMIKANAPQGAIQHVRNQIATQEVSQ